MKRWSYLFLCIFLSGVFFSGVSAKKELTPDERYIRDEVVSHLEEKMKEKNIQISEVLEIIDRVERKNKEYSILNYVYASFLRRDKDLYTKYTIEFIGKIQQSSHQKHQNERLDIYRYDPETNLQGTDWALVNTGSLSFIYTNMSHIYQDLGTNNLSYTLFSSQDDMLKTRRLFEKSIEYAKKSNQYMNQSSHGVFDDENNARIAGITEVIEEAYGPGCEYFKDKYKKDFSAIECDYIDVLRPYEGMPGQVFREINTFLTFKSPQNHFSLGASSGKATRYERYLGEKHSSDYQSVFIYDDEVSNITRIYHKN